MRGDKFIGGAGVQSATVFAGQVGSQTFKLRNRWLMALTVGELGSFYGYTSGQYGDLQPREYGGQVIVSLTADPADLLYLNTTADPLVGVDTLRVTLEGRASLDLSFSVGDDRYQLSVPGITAWMQARLGRVLGVRLGKVD